MKRKLEEVLRMETFVVEVWRVRARVKRTHIRALKPRLRRKKIWRKWSVSALKVETGISCMIQTNADSGHGGQLGLV